MRASPARRRACRDAFLREQSRHLRGGGGDKHTTHLVGILQHARALGVGRVRQKSPCAPGTERPPRAGLLVERRRGHRRHLSTERGIDGVLHTCIPHALSRVLIVPVSKSLSAMALNQHARPLPPRPSRRCAVGFVKPHCSAACSSTGPRTQSAHTAWLGRCSAANASTSGPTPRDPPSLRLFWEGSCVCGQPNH